MLRKLIALSLLAMIVPAIVGCDASGHADGDGVGVKVDTK